MPRLAGKLDAQGQVMGDEADRDWRLTRAGMRLELLARQLPGLPARLARALHTWGPNRLPAYSPSRGPLSRGVARLLERPSRRTGPDLSREVSVCVATVGQPTLELLERGLAAQDCRFAGPFVVRYVSPSGEALRRLTEVAETPTFVQLGEDMILKPYAVRAMHEALSTRPPEVAGLTFPLWDTHLQRTIMGVKVLRRAPLLEVPYRAVPGTGYDLERRLEQAGYRLETVIPRDALGREVLDDPGRFEVMGEHLVVGPTLLFERYQVLFGQLVREEVMDYLHRDFRRLLERLGLTAEDPDLWALLGGMSGLLQPPRADRTWHSYDAVPGLREVRFLVNQGPDTLILQPGSALPALQRSLLVFPHLRRLRLEDPRGAAEATLRGADLLEVLRSGARAGLELSLVTRDAPALCAEADRLREHRVSVELWLEPGAAVAESTWSVLASLSGRLVIEVDGRDTSGLRLDALRHLIDSAFAGQLAEVAIRHLPPAAEGAAPEPGADPLVPEHPGWAELERLKIEFPALCLPLPLRIEAPPGMAANRCSSPFRELLVDAEGRVSGCRAGLRALAPDGPSLFGGGGEELWYERQPRALRNEFLGKRPLSAVCSRCHWNHSS